MPSDFVKGRPQQRKTLADLIRQLMQTGESPRVPFMSSPTFRGPQAPPPQETNKETEQQRRRRLAQEALKNLRYTERG